MATTRVVVRQRVLQALGLPNNLTATSAGSTTVLNDTKLRRYAAVADVFNDRWWAYLSSGANTDATRLVTDSTTTQLTFSEAVTSTTTSDVYDLMPFDPAFANNAINQALRFLFDHGFHLPIYNETLLVDGLGLNMDFETYSAGFTSWTVASGTEAQETTRLIHGSNSLKLTSAAGTTARETQNLFTTVNVHEIQGRTLYFKGWLWCNTASKARLAVTFDGTFSGSNFFAGSYHGGDEEWEGPGTMYVAAVVPANATEMTLVCEVASGAATDGYFDNLMAWVSGYPINRYAIPTTIVRGPNLFIQAHRDRPKETDLRLPFAPEHVQPGLWIRMEGLGLPTQPTADATSIEVSAQSLELLVAQAVVELCGMAESVDSQRASLYQAKRAEYGAKVEGMLRSPQSPTTVNALLVNGWRKTGSGETPYVEFTFER